MKTRKYTYKQSVELKCYSCIVDPESVGTRKEQVACCVDADCPNFDNRPMPRQCRKNGELQLSEVAKTRSKVERLQDAKSARDRLSYQVLKPVPFGEESVSN